MWTACSDADGAAACRVLRLLALASLRTGAGCRSGSGGRGSGGGCRLFLGFLGLFVLEGVVLERLVGALDLGDRRDRRGVGGCFRCGVIGGLSGFDRLVGSFGGGLGDRGIRGLGGNRGGLGIGGGFGGGLRGFVGGFGGGHRGGLVGDLDSGVRGIGGRLGHLGSCFGLDCGGLRRLLGAGGCLGVTLLVGHPVIDLLSAGATFRRRRTRPSVYRAPGVPGRAASRPASGCI